MATTEFSGILVRASLQDTGTLPRSEPLQDSPDVSPQGGSAVADPQTLFTNTYDQNIAKPVVMGEVSHIYIRGKNLSTEDGQGVAYMYWARESDINVPTRWKTNQLLTTKGGDSIDLAPVAAGEITVGEPAFLWDPPADAASKSFALIGVISTNAHPNPVPGLRDRYFKFDEWVAGQGGVGTLKTTVQPPPKPKATVSTTGQYDLKNKAGDVYFYIKTTGIPVGSQVSFKAEKPDNTGSPIDLPWTTVNADPFRTGTIVPLDANWSSPITFNLILATGALPAATNSVTVYVGQYEETLGKAAKGEARVYGDGDGPAKFVILGQYTTTINVPVQPV